MNSTYQLKLYLTSIRHETFLLDTLLEALLGICMVPATENCLLTAALLRLQTNTALVNLV